MPSPCPLGLFSPALRAASLRRSHWYSCCCFHCSSCYRRYYRPLAPAQVEHHSDTRWHGAPAVPDFSTGNRLHFSVPFPLAPRLLRKSFISRCSQQPDPHPPSLTLHHRVSPPLLLPLPWRTIPSPCFRHPLSSAFCATVCDDDTLHRPRLTAAVDFRSIGELSLA